jgi:hypothetical protein
MRGRRSRDKDECKPRQPRVGRLKIEWVCASILFLCNLLWIMSTQQQPPDTNVLTQKRSKPWKEVGYRGFSAFIASDNDFLIFRRFGSLNARLILYLQDQITVLESSLEELEKKHMTEDAQDSHHGSFRREQLSKRTELLEKINKKVREYSKGTFSRRGATVLIFADELLIQHSALRNHPKVPERNRESILNWLYNKQNTGVGSCVY